MKKYLIIATLSCLPLAAYSQTETIELQPTDDSWKFTVTPYLWATSLNGKLVIADNNIPVELNFADDLLSSLKMGAMFHAEARKNKLSFMLDAFYAKLGEDSEVTGPLANTGDLRVRLKQTIIEGGLGYEFARTGSFSMEALAGGRFFDTNTNVKVNDVEIATTDFNFFDPYVGVRFVNEWNKVGISGRADIGGFGVGSEYSYKLNGILYYKFTETLISSIGYQLYRPDYEDGQFEYNIGNQGFLLGFTFGF